MYGIILLWRPEYFVSQFLSLFIIHILLFFQKIIWIG